MQCFRSNQLQSSDYQKKQDLSATLACVKLATWYTCVPITIRPLFNFLLS